LGLFGLPLSFACERQIMLTCHPKVFSSGHAVKLLLFASFTLRNERR
jgi:hypothetical protein